MDLGLVFAKTRGRCAESLLHPGKPARWARRAELRSLPATDQNSTKGSEGRLPSLRAKLLPALSPRRAPCRSGRHLDQPCRLSMPGAETVASGKEPDLHLRSTQA